MEFVAPKVLLFKIETIEGVDPTPTGAANAILIQDDVTPPKLNITYADRKLARGFFGHDQQLYAGAAYDITFAVEAAGAGTAGDAPKYGPLLKCCAMDETLTALTDALYKPISALIPSATIYFYYSGKLHKLLGARGNPTWTFNDLGIPMIQFQFTGLYGGIVDDVFPSATLTGFQVPLPVNYANTGSVSLHGYAARVYDCSFTLGNKIVYRNIVGVEQVIITDREPSGSIEIEDIPVATKDYVAIAKAGTLGAFSFVHGTTSGNKVKPESATCQITSPEYGDRDGISTTKLSLRFTPGAAGNDDIAFRVL